MNRDEQQKESEIIILFNTVSLDNS